MWHMMVTYFGFTTSPTDTTVPGPSSESIAALTRFSTRHTHSSFDLSQQNMCAEIRLGAMGSSGVVHAVCEGWVNKGEMRTWKMCKYGNGGDVYFGFVNNSEAESMPFTGEAHTNLQRFAGFYHDGRFKGAGEIEITDTKKRCGDKLPWGGEIELCLDTRDQNAPVVVLKSHSEDRLPIPKEWGGYRLVVGANTLTPNVAVQIMSVD
eukprot:GDKI01014449.1.p1 GENE.GDKI01014449.1~~GDKI01014449.1.p1  ORF type:complete len:226 (+),score=42.93 GDKI01014449.1:58-678(+)